MEALELLLRFLHLSHLHLLMFFVLLFITFPYYRSLSNTKNVSYHLDSEFSEYSSLFIEEVKNTVKKAVPFDTQYAFRPMFNRLFIVFYFLLIFTVTVVLSNFVSLIASYVFLGILILDAQLKYYVLNNLFVFMTKPLKYMFSIRTQEDISQRFKDLINAS